MQIKIISDVKFKLFQSFKIQFSTQFCVFVLQVN